MAVRVRARGIKALSVVATVLVIGSIPLAFLSPARLSKTSDASRQSQLRTQLGAGMPDQDAPLVAPSGPPTSFEEMTALAADSCMRAYRDGYTRQNINLRLDLYGDSAEVASSGLPAVQARLKASIPIIEDFVKQLWYNDYLDNLTTNMIDDEATTMLYRQATNDMQDAACIFFPGRQTIISAKVSNFLNGMGDRLVVIANTAGSAAPWKVSYQGREFLREQDKGMEISRVFAQESFWHETSNINNWKTTLFRAYPHPWQLWIEDFTFTNVKLADMIERPTNDQIQELQREYEVKYNVTVMRKLGKTIKDFDREEGPPEA